MYQLKDNAELFESCRIKLEARLTTWKKYLIDEFYSEILAYGTKWLSEAKYNDCKITTAIHRVFYEPSYETGDIDTNLIAHEIIEDIGMIRGNYNASGVQLMSCKFIERVSDPYATVSVSYILEEDQIVNKVTSPIISRLKSIVGNRL